MTSLTTWTEKRVIDGQEYTVSRIEEMDYNGEWHGKFRVRKGNVEKTLFGYPIDSDIKKLFS